ncbi:MAG: CopD family protein [Gammaproteobacteria bacterium]|nr:CopD family protein [Gammaproteobacteria bacterium]MCY4210902.1 CopD family protein [Gammaproteobacteria bacterium]MCY4281594.1 CopD family protein [Gammaproteobacteria bacterium]
MLLLKSLHLIFMVTWFAGLFYLPRLFVYHALSDDAISIDRFKIMERKLYFGIMTPGAVLTLVCGLWLAVANGWDGYAAQTWFQVKLALLLLLLGYHLYCGKLLQDFKHDRNRHTHVWYRWYNEIPVLFLVAIMLLAVYKPL